MDKFSVGLTVFFNNPFWVGVFECISDGNLSVCKVTFGSEPKDYELYSFIKENYLNLSFSQGVAFELKRAVRNPKKAQRDIKKQIESRGIGTKSQMALKAQIEQFKTERKTIRKQSLDAEKLRKFKLKQQKKKEKHKGR